MCNVGVCGGGNLCNSKGIKICKVKLTNQKESKKREAET